MKKSNASGIVVLLILIAVAGVYFITLQDDTVGAPVVNDTQNNNDNVPAMMNDSSSMGMTSDSSSMAKMPMVPSEKPELTTQQTAELAAGAADHASKTLTFNVTGGSFYFVPNEIRVKKGDTVKIVFNDAGGMHNFTLDEFNVKINTLKTGETGTAEFVADKSGTFQFYCGVGQHRQMGQVGNLIVE